MLHSGEHTDPFLQNADSDEYFEQYRVTVDRKQELLRIDKFLMNRMENISRTRLQTAADAGCILVNNKPVKSNYRVKPGDDISVIFPKREEKYSLKPENIPLEILYEDASVIVINKQAGLVVHPGVGNYSGTLVNALMFHFGILADNPDEPFRPGLVHRIDKNTSGILVVAKTEIAMSKLAKQFFDHSVERKYTALVWGEFEEKTGTITGSIGRHPRHRKLFSIHPPESESAKHAITHYRVLEDLLYVSLVECVLETGRTHQIRVHMQHAGHPIFSDDTYGGDKIVKGTVYTKYKQFVENCFALMPRQALHARSLGFEHPESGKWMYFETDLPADFNAVLDKWRTYTNGLK